MSTRYNQVRKTYLNARPGRTNALAARLSFLDSLDASELGMVHSLTRNRRELSTGEIVVHEGSKPCFAIAIMAGVAIRYKHLADGRRQIFGYLLPGDLCESHFIFANRADHSIGLLTDSEIAIISSAELTAAIVTYPKIDRAIRQASLIEDSILREWLLNIGQRDACQKVAHFLCEIARRLDALAMVEDDGGFSISLTQTELADTVGLTVVHVNRCLQRLRLAGLVNWNRRRLSIIDLDGLIRFAEFDEHYLRLGPSGAPPVGPLPGLEWIGGAAPGEHPAYA